MMLRPTLSVPEVKPQKNSAGSVGGPRSMSSKLAPEACYKLVRAAAVRSGT